MEQSQKEKQIIPIIIIALVTVIFIILSISYLVYIQKLTDENTLKNLSELTKQEVARIRKIINEENINNEEFEGIFAESLYNGEGYEYIINSNGEVVANSVNRENGYNLYNIINTLEDKNNQQKLNNTKEAKKMQADLEKSQQELAQKEFEASAGGNAVSVKVNGSKQIIDLKIQKDVVDPDDVEMLQDLIVTCINQAFKQVDDAQSASMGKFNIPGIM